MHSIKLLEVFQEHTSRAPDGIPAMAEVGIAIIWMCIDFHLHTNEVMALQRANGDASRHQVLKQSLSPRKVATDAAATVGEESGWLHIHVETEITLLQASDTKKTFLSTSKCFTWLNSVYFRREKPTWSIMYSIMYRTRQGKNTKVTPGLKIPYNKKGLARVRIHKSTCSY